MPITDTDTRLSPGWWFDRLSRDLASKQPRYKILDDYFIGRPPLVNGTPNQQSVFWKFQQIARSNFAALIVQARRDRLAVRTIRTGADSSENGDARANELFVSGNGPKMVSDVGRYVTEFGRGYVATALKADRTPFYSAEDPRLMTAYVDSTSGETLAALKLYHDFLTDQDIACLWLPGQKLVAVRDRKISVPRQAFADGPPPPIAVSYSSRSFNLLPTRDEAEKAGVEYDAYSEEYGFQDVPVEEIDARDGVGCYELHTDVLDRINNQILQRVVIAAMQAFRQRGLELEDDLPDYDEQGNKIDYDDIFSADPGALWRLPKGAKIWESQQVDLQGILASVTDDVKHLSANTKTPLPMFSPDTANQTAEGAQNAREGLVFDIEDLQRSIGRGVAAACSTSFRMLSDESRATLGSLTVEWLPAERYSLAEKAAADAQAQSLTWEQRQRIIWQQTPDEIRQAESQRATDALNGLIGTNQRNQSGNGLA